MSRQSKIAQGIGKSGTQFIWEILLTMVLRHGMGDQLYNAPSKRTGLP